MIRKLAYLLIIMGMVLATANLTLSHSLASEGKFFQQLIAQRQEKDEVISTLKQEVMMAASVEAVAKRAQQLGFTPKYSVVSIQSDSQPTLASGQ